MSLRIGVILLLACLVHTRLGLCQEGEVEQGSSQSLKETKREDVPKEKLREREVESLHKMTIGGVEISYRATAGLAHIRDDDDKVIGSLFYVAYTKEHEDSDSLASRPVAFCFNGGPGSSSMWVHMGLLGPKRVVLSPEGGVVYQPYRAVDNPFSLLDKVDLVFIDPVTVGYGRASPGEDLKQFYGFKEDVKTIAQFIHFYVAHNGRWESPKFLIGESYGTTRAVGLASHLLKKYCMEMTGLVLISSVLDYSFLDADNDLSYSLLLPSYTNVAAVHNKLAPELQNDMEQTRREVQEFALGEYLIALTKGDRLSKEERTQLIDKLVRYTGLSASYLDKANLRVPEQYFAKNVLAEKKEVVGHYDGRIKGFDPDLLAGLGEFDPSTGAVLPGFTAIFNTYLKRDLNWDSDDQYITLNDSICTWHWSDSPFSLNVVPLLRDVLAHSHQLNIFVASGDRDLVTPYFATHYTFNHLNLDAKIMGRIRLRDYHGGHMMYLYEDVLEQMKKDLDQFLSDALHFSELGDKVP